MMLSLANEDKKLKVVQVREQSKLSKKLCDLGIYNDSELRIVKNDISGPVIVEVKGSKIILGRGQAQKIMVEDV